MAPVHIRPKAVIVMFICISVALFRDPFRKGKNKLVLCETYQYNHKPTRTNTRKSCLDVMESDVVKVSLLKQVFSYSLHSLKKDTKTHLENLSL